jgi:hypothetical protein
MPAGRRKRTGGDSITRHPPGADLDGAPARVGEIEVNVTGMLGDAR